MCSLPPPLEGHSCLCPLTSSTLTSLGGDPKGTKCLQHGSIKFKPQLISACPGPLS